MSEMKEGMRCKTCHHGWWSWDPCCGNPTPSELYVEGMWAKNANGYSVAELQDKLKAAEAEVARLKKDWNTQAHFWTVDRLKYDREVREANALLDRAADLIRELLEVEMRWVRKGVQAKSEWAEEAEKALQATQAARAAK